MYTFAYLDAKHYVTGIADVYILKDWDREGKANSTIINPFFEGCALRIAQFSDCICNYQKAVKMVVGWLSNSTEWGASATTNPPVTKNLFPWKHTSSSGLSAGQLFWSKMSKLLLLIRMQYRRIDVFWTLCQFDTVKLNPHGLKVV